jgi:hypothetical protein
MGLGLVIRIIGPMASELNSTFMNNAWKKLFNLGFYSLTSRPKLVRVLILEVFLSTTVILFWPIFLLLFLLNKKASKKIEDEPIPINPEIEIKYFYLDGMKSPGSVGVGNLRCSDCLNEENISIATHSRDSNGDFLGNFGFQCQSCGLFEVITNPDFEKTYSCGCGGILSRDEKVFCPKCHSFRVEYRSRYLT